MIIKTLRLLNFRNYSDETFSFGPRLNIIQGGNAQGKTNLLEAIYLLSTGKSFRTAHLNELIMQGKAFFQLEAEIVKDLVGQTISIYFDANQKKALHNTTLLPSFTTLLGIFPSVLHAPSDIELISGLPSIRRRFLNLHLAQPDPVYVHHLSRFFKALKQRNFLLKSQNLNSIEVWEHEMAKSASYLTLKRGKMIAQLNDPTNQITKVLSNAKEEVTLRYTPALFCDPDMKITYEAYAKQLEKCRKKDMALKTTTLGPHRDDFICYIDKKPAKIFASEGQKRGLVSALKLAEYSLLCEKLQSPAIMNIDDIGVHLDGERQERLHSLIKNLNQVFITTPENPNKWIGEDFKIITISDGKQLF